MQIKLTIREEVGVISLEGDLGHKEMIELKSVITRLLCAGEPRVVLDLGQVDHVDYKYLKLLAERRLRLVSCGGDLRLAAPSEYVMNIFRFGGYHDHFHTCDSVDEAVESFLEEEEETVFAGQSRSWVPRFH